MKKQLPKISLISFSAILLMATGLYLKASAQETQRTITISPPSEVITLNPGQRSEGKLKLINNGDAPLTFSVTTKDFIVTDTQGTPHIVGDDEKVDQRFSASSWLDVYPRSFTVAPHQKQDLTYYIQVPSNARPGGHYAAVVYTPDMGAGKDETGAAINSQIGTLFLIGVGGPITESANVSLFTAPFSEYGPVDVFTQIRNLGDLHIRPLGNITVTDLLGKTVSTTMKEQNIFPAGGLRDYTNTVGQKLMIGPYKAKMTATYGKENDKFLVATVTFWVFPWKITLIIVLIIIALVLYFKLYRKRKNRKTSPPAEAPVDETAN
jgi:hypothetical protein